MFQGKRSGIPHPRDCAPLYRGVRQPQSFIYYVPKILPRYNVRGEEPWTEHLSPVCANGVKVVIIPGS